MSNNLYEHTIDFAREADYTSLEVLDYYITSIGCHIANLFNTSSIYEYATPFYFRNRKPFPVRANIFAIGPPGYGKTAWHRFFFDQDYGCAISLPHKHEKRLTELSLVGGFDKSGEKIIGHAEEYKDAIILCDEYSALKKSSKQEHSLQLEEALLGLLDDGWVYKSTGGHDLKYQSYITAWLATQNARFDNESGMPRRLNYLDMSPDQTTIKAFNQKVINNPNTPPKLKGLRDLRHHFSELAQTFTATKSIRTASLRNFLLALSQRGYNHNELILIENLAIGYSLIKYYRATPVLRITVDKTFKAFALDALNRRLGVLANANYNQILTYIKSLPEGCSHTQLMKYLVFSGWSRRRARETINDMLLHKVLLKAGGEGLGRGMGRAPIFYFIGDDSL